MTTIDASDVSEITIDGVVVDEITMDGDVVWSGGVDEIETFDDWDSSDWDVVNDTTIQDTTVAAGSHAATLGTSGELEAPEGSSSLPNYFEPGDEAEWYVYPTMSDGWLEVRIRDWDGGDRYIWYHDFDGGDMEIRDRVSGSTSTVVEANYTWETDAYQRIEAVAGESGGLEARVYDSSGTVQVDISGTSSASLGSHGFEVQVFNTTGDVHVDQFVII